MRGEKVLVIGCTGQVTRPVTKALARQNEVRGIARFHIAAVYSAFAHEVKIRRGGQ